MKLEFNTVLQSSTCLNCNDPILDKHKYCKDCLVIKRREWNENMKKNHPKPDTIRICFKCGSKFKQNRYGKYCIKCR